MQILESNHESLEDARIKDAKTIARTTPAAKHQDKEKSRDLKEERRDSETHGEIHCDDVNSLKT